MTVWVELDLCNGCKRCLKACPYDAIELREGKAYVLERCTSCGACLQVCKPNALQTDVKPREIPDFSDRKGVWVFAEQAHRMLHRVSLELLGKAQDLGQDLQEPVSAVLLGDNVGSLAELLTAHGAETVYLVDAPELKEYRTLPYTAALEALIRKHKPNIFLFGATPLGRDLAPRLSRRVGVGLTADCTELAIDPDERILLQTRPAFGGNVMATIANRYSRPQMATVRPGVMEIRPTPEGRGKIVPCSVPLDESSFGTRVLEHIRSKGRRVDLAEARVVVAGGRGAGGERGFALLRELADLLGGQMAGTRVAAEAGWIPVERQVGQTGQSVRPELYIACGISGAIQHRAGMMNSRFIVAVNTDPRAPIFQVADWGIVGDMHDVIPEMLSQIRELKGL